MNASEILEKARNDAKALRITMGRVYVNGECKYCPSS